jgi:hypothetical protein
MFTLNRVLSGALLTVALLGGQMAHADDEKAVNLMVKPKVGRILQIKSVVKTTIMGMDLVVNQTQKDTIKEVKENGDVVEETFDEGGTVIIGGAEQNQPVTPPYTMTRDKFGKIKEFRKDAGSGFMTPEVAHVMEMITSFVLTDKAVKTNDTWQTEMDNPAVKEKKITVKDTYLGLDKIDGKSYWKIKQTSEAVVDADGGKVTIEVTEWVNPADGEAVKVEGTVKDVPTQVGALTMQITSKSAKASDKDKSEPIKL